MSLFSPLSATRQAKNPSVVQTTGSKPSLDDPTTEPEESIKEVDSNKLAYNEIEVKGMASVVQRTMISRGLVIKDEQLASARKIMYKVAGLSRCVNNSATLGSLFFDLVAKDPELEGNLRALTRHVATRWNTDCASLNSHLHFKSPVQWLTGNPKLKLQKYTLDEEQWNLAAELSAVLEVFQEPTDCFSQSEVPLIHETLPELLALRARLLDIRDDVLMQNLHPITQTAAEAALLVFDKYIGAMQESDYYDISIVMCPNQKLKWFLERGYDTNPIRTRVLARFEASYSSKASGTTNTFKPSPKNSGNIWTQRHSSSAVKPTQLEDDSIEHYLNSATISEEALAQHGGILSYWSSQLDQRPRVARMALDYLTAPASSVDAERAFSGGRLMINHLQHQMSSRTFQAQMAVGSWFNTPLLPSLSDAANIIENCM